MRNDKKIKECSEEPLKNYAKKIWPEYEKFKGKKFKFYR